MQQAMNSIRWIDDINRALTIKFIVEYLQIWTLFSEAKGWGGGGWGETYNQPRNSFSSLEIELN